MVICLECCFLVGDAHPTELYFRWDAVWMEYMYRTSGFNREEDSPIADAVGGAPHTKNRPLNPVNPACKENQH